MPICPGCERTIPYDRLDLHERHCLGIWSAARFVSPSIERLEAQLTAMETHLDGRLRSLEEDVNQRLGRLERRAGNRRPGDRR